ncbi:uncharacterized protein LOC143043658 [Mytilus galloprovincialis]|uniref:uncharacterized protein LOC143043658 n=1 Tax=Mytilus galloprovincialis TaxID=29158 RepID=UPI003F7CAA68
MVKSCCAYMCHSKANETARNAGISFFRFPKDKRKRSLWTKVINRADWEPNDSVRICSLHFVDGWHSDDPDDINYVPTIFIYKEKTLSTKQKARETRTVSRQETKNLLAEEQLQRCIDQTNRDSAILDHSYSTVEPEVEISVDHNAMDVEDDIELPYVQARTIGFQCDPDPLLMENLLLRKEIKELKDQLAEESKRNSGIHRIKDDDSATKFYTGLPTFTVFLWLFNYLCAKSSRMQYWKGDGNTPSKDRVRVSTSRLQPIEQFLAVMMRLRLGLYVRDVADRFSISVSSYSSYFTTWLNLIHAELEVINIFPPRDIITRTMPNSFKDRYPSTRVIIDCTEIFIQKASSLLNQSLTYSSYKHHNTLKFLVGITPSGVISFVSEGWGRRVSDREITIECGILDLLEPGDNVMADKGFTINDLLVKRQCALNIPPFRGIKDQFTTDEVFQTQEIAQLRIHVERSIGRVKNFHILEGVLPLSIAPLSTKIFQTCCWLTNLDVPLVQDDINDL